MTQIYTVATDVFIWLGESGSEIDLAIDAFPLILKNLDKSEDVISVFGQEKVSGMPACLNEDHQSGRVLRSFTPARGFSDCGLFKRPSSPNHFEFMRRKSNTLASVHSRVANSRAIEVGNNEQKFQQLRHSGALSVCKNTFRMLM